MMFASSVISHSTRTGSDRCGLEKLLPRNVWIEMNGWIGGRWLKECLPAVVTCNFSIQHVDASTLAPAKPCACRSIKRGLTQSQRSQWASFIFRRPASPEQYLTSPYFGLYFPTTDETIRRDRYASNQIADKVKWLGHG